MIEEKEITLQQKDNVETSMDLSKDVITRLKEWRRHLSKEQDVPAYIIMPDRTLIDIAQKMPLKSDELEEVHGLGPARIMKYGEEILKVVNGQ